MYFDFCEMLQKYHSNFIFVKCLLTFSFQCIYLLDKLNSFWLEECSKFYKIVNFVNDTMLMYDDDNCFWICSSERHTINVVRCTLKRMRKSD